MSRRQEIARAWKGPLSLSFQRCKRLTFIVEQKFMAAGMTQAEIFAMLEKDTKHDIARAAASEWDFYKRMTEDRQDLKNFFNEMSKRVSSRFGCSHQRASKIVDAAFKDIREQRKCTRAEARQALAESTRTDFAVFGIELDDDEVLYDDEIAYPEGGADEDQTHGRS